MKQEESNALKEQVLIDQEKINYLIQYASIMKKNMMAMLGNGKNILYLIKSILLSEKPLNQCEEFIVLNKFLLMTLNQMNEKENEADAQTVLSTIYVYESRAGSQMDTDKILIYQMKMRNQIQKENMAS